MKKSISILGCGWLGLSLGKTLSEYGFIVKGSTTSISKIEDLKNNGIQPFIINLNTNNIDLIKFLKSEILIIAITSKDINGFKKLITEIEKSIIKKVVFISSTSVYPTINDIVNEGTQVRETSLSIIENLFKTNFNFKSTIIRFGGLIGYDRKPGNFFKDGKTIDHPEGFVNLIHRDDCINIIQEIIEKNIWNVTLNACTDSHPTRREFYTKEFKKAGRIIPRFNEDSINDYKIISSEKLKNLLNYHFKYSNLLEY